MDPVSHVIVARAIVAAIDTPERSRFGRGVGAAAMLGGLSPDADSVLMPAGWDVYLRFHEIGTHSLLGAALIGCGAGVLIHSLVRRARKRAEASNPGRAGPHITHASGLAIAAVIGAISHLALDVISGARLGLWWPLLSARTTLPLVAMADLWLIVLLAAGAAVMWLGRRQLPRAALVVLVTVIGFLGVKGVMYAHVRHMVHDDGRLAGGTKFAFEAQWGSWSIWNVFDRDADRLRAWRADARTGQVDLTLSWPIEAESSDITTSRSLDTVRNFLSVHDLGFAVVEQEAMGRRAVLWSDVRFCRQTAPAEAHIDCALWFGGILDASGHPLSQVVRVGGWTQTRSISE